LQFLTVDTAADQLFISYFEDVTIVFNARHIQYHVSANDKQLLASAPVAEAPEAKMVERCITAINVLSVCIPLAGTE